VARTRPTSPATLDGDGPAARPADAASYTVVARRYRPQRFEDVVGQDHVVQALRNAIRLNRVTHAYLFSGTRGVGKTSMARIFAKCLNCVRGPTEEPCNACDICRAIAIGQDDDVIEIDGASNNGVDAVRELRQNAGLRPSRARFKIYYIDEVHMLSTGAFNALLKTLEEPPPHVKFFFATTEPGKIPITVLSRCQRFDFAAIPPERIAATLAEICKHERVEADPDALRAVARRAGGSLRDAESLLEQLVASGDRRLTADRVHQLLGTAPDDRVLDLLEAMAGRDLAGVLKRVEESVAAGVQPVDLLGGALEFLRDALILKAGADVTLLGAGPDSIPRLKALADRWSLDSLLAAQQILAEARGRLRGSPHGRLLVELALCRVARLEDLAELSEVVGRLAALESGAGPPPVKKKASPAENGAPRPASPAIGRAHETSKPHPPADGPAPAGDGAPLDPSRPLELEDVRGAWPRLVAAVGSPIDTYLNPSRLRPVAILGPNVLVIEPNDGYNWVADLCEKAEARARIESALRAVFGRPLTLRFERAGGPAAGPSAPPPAARIDEIAADPFVQAVVRKFDARPYHIDRDGGEAGADG
jgi:DNA polymerase III subunit gamma/tau